MTETFPTTTTTTELPLTTKRPSLTFSAFRRKTSVSGNEEEEEFLTTITPDILTTEPYNPHETPLKTVEEELIPVQNIVTEAPDTNIQETFITDIPKETTFPPPSSTTQIPQYLVSSNSPQVPKQKPRKTIKIRPTRGPFRQNDILPRGRAINSLKVEDQEESHSEANVQTVQVSEDQTFHVRGRGRARFNVETNVNNQDFEPRASRNFRQRSTTPSQEAEVKATVRPELIHRVRSKPTISDQTERIPQHVTEQIHRGRAFTSRGRSTAIPVEPSTTLAPEIPSPRNQPRRFESRFSINSATDSPITHIKSSTSADVETTTGVPPIRITLNSALNFGYANKKQFRQQIFTIQDDEVKEKEVNFKVLEEDDSPVIRPQVNVRFGVHVKESTADLETSNLVTKAMEPNDDKDSGFTSTLAPEQGKEKSTADFGDTLIEGQTFIPLEEGEENVDTTTPTETTIEFSTETSKLEPESTVATTVGSTRERTRFNIRRRPTTVATLEESNDEEPIAPSTAPPQTTVEQLKRTNIASQRRRTTTQAPLLVEKTEEEVEKPVGRSRQRSNFNLRNRQQIQTVEETQEPTRGEQLKTLEESLTLNPTRGRGFSRSRQRTTTEAAVVEASGETLPITISSTFSPRSRSRFLNGRPKNISPTVDEVTENTNAVVEVVTRRQLFQSRTRSTAAPEIEITQEDQVEEDFSRRPPFQFKVRQRTTKAPLEEPEAVTLNDDEEIELRNTLRNIQKAQTTIASENNDDDKSETQITNEPSSNPGNRFNLLRNRFSTQRTTETVQETTEELVDNESVTASSLPTASTSRFNNFKSRSQISTTQQTEVPTQEEENNNTSVRPAKKRRIIKRPRQRTTVGLIEEEITTPVPSAVEEVSATERLSIFNQRRQRPVSSTTEVIIEPSEEPETVVEHQTPRGRNIRVNLFNRNLIQESNQKNGTPIVEDNENPSSDSPVENRGRVTQRRKIIRKKKPTPAEPEHNENDNVQEDSAITQEEEEVEQPRRRKIIRKIRPKTTLSEKSLESATESLNAEELTNQSTESTHPTPRTTLRRGKTQDLAKTLADLRRNRAQAQEQEAPERHVDEQQPDDEEEDQDQLNDATPSAVSRFTPRSRVPYSPKRPAIQTVTEPIVRANSPSPRNRFSSRVKLGRKTQTEETATENEDVQEEDALSVSIRPLNFTPNKNREAGTRFRNTFKGTAANNNGEVLTVLKPRTNLFSTQSRFRPNKLANAKTEKENEIEFEEVTPATFDDDQYVDDNYEGSTNTDSEVSPTTASTTQKVTNVPISLAKKPLSQRPLYNPKNRKSNIPNPLRKSNTPHSASKTEPINGRKANTPANASVVGTDTSTVVESTTIDVTQETEDKETQTDHPTNNTSQETEAEEESITDNINDVDLQEHYARGGNGTPTPGPLASFLNRTFKPKKHPSTTTKPTTLHHVFAIDEPTEDKSEGKKNMTEGSAEEVSKKLRKLVEVNRIVEVNSKQQKVSPSEASDELGLVAEKLPRLDRIGEISRLAVVKLKTAEREGRAMNLLLPEMIFGVETSTISLEGLFEKERKAKELVVKLEKDDQNNTINVVYAKTDGQEITTTTTATPETETPAKDDNIVRPLVPMLRPESSDDNPYVITIANLDQVILRKVNLQSQPTLSSSEVTDDSTTVVNETTVATGVEN